MAHSLTRRQFLSLTAGATALGLGTRSDLVEASTPTAPTRLLDPATAPFDTVVVLMMENRSFDHLLGWLPGANGRQQGLSYVDQDGHRQETWPLAPDFQGCLYGDPDHTWEGIETQYNYGRCDGFLQTAKAGDRFPIGYYREDELPILSALAKGYTTFDAYFCSMMGPTWQNRLYQLTGTTQLTPDCDFPGPGQRRPVTIDTAIFDRVCEAGLTAGYYYHAEPMTGIFESRRYDHISYSIDRFWADAREGKLPNIVFVDPNYTDRAEDMGTSNDYHPWGNVLVAEGFIAQVHNTLKNSPQWARLVFVLNFDEHGGFFDHVPPPACQDDTVLETEGRRSEPGGGGPFFPNLRRLGFRVPAIAMGPFAPRKVETAGPYEHCSILKMIEWRWGLAPLTVRDRYARNLARALDFSQQRDPIDLPSFPVPPAKECSEGGGWTELEVRGTWVRVVCDGPSGAVCMGRIVAGPLEVASAPVTTIGAGNEVVLWMKLTHDGRRLIRSGGAPRRVRALLETTLLEGEAPACRRTSPAILVPHPSWR